MNKSINSVDSPYPSFVTSIRIDVTVHDFEVGVDGCGVKKDLSDCCC